MNQNLLEHKDTCYESMLEFCDSIMVRDYQASLDLYTELARELAVLQGRIESSMEDILRKIVFAELATVNSLGDFIKTGDDIRCRDCRMRYIERVLNDNIALIMNQLIPMYSHKLDLEFFDHMGLGKASSTSLVDREALKADSINKKEEE